jgi:DUF4097 and DUF4098 domain-containing protein YvlB
MKRTSVFFIVLSFAAACIAPAAPAGSGDRTKTFPVGKGGTLDVTIRGGDIVINTWDRDEVSVRIRGVDDDEDPGLRMTQSGTRVLIEDAGASSDDFTLEVTLPSRFDVRLRSSSGDIEIDGPLNGRLNGATGGGNIRLRNLGGSVEMKTSGGDITSGDIGGDLDLNTSGGDIRMGTVSGNATIITSGGDITVANIGKKIRASTSGGSIAIGDVGGEATVSTSGGDITAGSVSGNASLTTAGGNVMLHGATGTVRATSAGGDLQLENVTGSVEGSTAGGNVVAFLNPAKNGRSRLNTAGGDIRLVVPEGAKVTINARIHIGGWWRVQKDTYDIRSDFAMEKYEKNEQSHEIRATILVNGGGEQVTLDAVSGNIEVRKGRP